VRLRNGIPLALLVLLPLAAPVPGASAGGCITTLPIKASLQESNPRNLDDFVPLDVVPRGPKLRRVKIGLYSFHGRRMAERRVDAIAEERSLRLRIHNTISSGSYTLYAEGEPNPSRSCGPKHWSKVVRIGSAKKKESSGKDDGDDGKKDSGKKDGSKKQSGSGSSGGGGSEGNPDEQIPQDQRL
jgi:uncharacterized membrane protein YgcG